MALDGSFFMGRINRHERTPTQTAGRTQVSQHEDPADSGREGSNPSGGGGWRCEAGYMGAQCPHAGCQETAALAERGGYDPIRERTDPSGRV